MRSLGIEKATNTSHIMELAEIVKSEFCPRSTRTLGSSSACQSDMSLRNHCKLRESIEEDKEPFAAVNGNYPRAQASRVM